jgi:hypothetical protein
LKEKGRLAALVLLGGNEPLRRSLPTELIVRQSTCLVRPPN